MHYQTMSMSYQHHIVTRLFSHDRVCGVSTKLCQSISIQFRYTNVSGAGTRLGGPNIGGKSFSHPKCRGNHHLSPDVGRMLDFLVP